MTYMELLIHVFWGKWINVLRTHTIVVILGQILFF